MILVLFLQNKTLYFTDDDEYIFNIDPLISKGACFAFFTNYGEGNFGYTVFSTTRNNLLVVDPDGTYQTKDSEGYYKTPSVPSIMIYDPVGAMGDGQITFYANVNIAPNINTDYATYDDLVAYVNSTGRWEPVGILYKLANGEIYRYEGNANLVRIEGTTDDIVHDIATLSGDVIDNSTNITNLSGALDDYVPLDTKDVEGGYWGRTDSMLLSAYNNHMQPIHVNKWCYCECMETVVGLSGELPTNVSFPVGVFNEGDVIYFEQRLSEPIIFVSEGSNPPSVKINNSSLFNLRSSKKYSVVGVRFDSNDECTLFGERELNT